MVCGGIIFWKPAGLVVSFNGGNNSQVYLSILSYQIPPIFAKVFPGGKAIFQADSVSIYTVKIIIEWHEVLSNEVEQLIRFRQSPYLNIIGYSWCMH